MQTKTLQSPGIKTEKNRNSNLELYRIIAMLLIVAHHYVVNSGLANYDGVMYYSPLALRSIFLFVFGAWGKTGINCFVLITGYFMCTSHITARKFAQLLGEVLFYNVVIYLVFLISGYEPFSFSVLVTSILPITDIGLGFTSCFLIFYLCIPFLNILIHHIDERKHILLLILSAFVYVLFGTLHRINMNYVSWYIVLYFIASYIRLYPKKWQENTKLCGILALVSLLVSIASIIFCLWVVARTGLMTAYYFLSDSNSILAVLTGITSFLFFCNLKIGYSRIINTIGSSTFGVLMIHANSDTMRRWLWQDQVDCIGHYQAPLMPLYAIGCVIIIFFLCIVIDYLRIRFVEKPFLKLWDRHFENITSRVLKPRL